MDEHITASDDERGGRGKAETHLVVITMMSTICSHTMRQKSPNVFGKGPAGAQEVEVVMRRDIRVRLCDI